MISILSNPFLRKKQNYTPSSSDITIRSNIGLTTAILTLFSLTVISYVLFWLVCSEIFINNPDRITDIQNFSFVSGVLSFSVAFFAYYKPEFSPILAPMYAVF